MADIDLSISITGLEGLNKLLKVLEFLQQQGYLTQQEFERLTTTFNNVIREKRSLIAAADVLMKELQQLAKNNKELAEVLDILKDTELRVTLTEEQHFKELQRLLETYSKFTPKLIEFAKFNEFVNQRLKKGIELFHELTGGISRAIVKFVSVVEAVKEVYEAHKDIVEILVEFNNVLTGLGYTIRTTGDTFLALMVGAGATDKQIKETIRGLSEFRAVLYSGNITLIEAGRLLINYSRALGVSQTEFAEFIDQIVAFSKQGTSVSFIIKDITRGLAGLNVSAKAVIDVLRDSIAVLRFMGVSISNAIRSIGTLESILRAVGISAKEFLKIGTGLAAVTLPNFASSLQSVVIIQQLMNRNLQRFSVSLQDVRDFMVGNIRDTKMLVDMLWALAQSLSENRELIGVYAELTGISAESLMKLANMAELGRQRFERFVNQQSEQARLNRMLAASWADISVSINRIVGLILQLLKPFADILGFLSQILGVFLNLPGQISGTIGWLLRLVGIIWLGRKAVLIVRTAFLELKLVIVSIVKDLQAIRAQLALLAQQAAVTGAAMQAMGAGAAGAAGARAAGAGVIGGFLGKALGFIFSPWGLVAMAGVYGLVYLVERITGWSSTGQYRQIRSRDLFEESYIRSEIGLPF